MDTTALRVQCLICNTLGIEYQLKYLMAISNFCTFPIRNITFDQLQMNTVRKLSKLWEHIRFRRNLVLLFCVSRLTLPAQEFSKIWLDPLPTFTSADTTRLMRAIVQGRALEQKYPDSAKTIYQQTLKTSKRLRFTYGAAIALFEIASIYDEEGLFDSAIFNYRHALFYGRQLRHPNLLVPALYCNIGNQYLAQGNNQKAIQHFDSAIQVGIRYGLAKDREHALNIYYGMSVVYLRLANYHSALYYTDLIIAISRKKNYGRQLTSALLNKGEIYRLQRKYKEAKVCYLEAAALAEKKHYPISRQLIYAGLAEMLVDLRDTGQAAMYISRLVQTQDIQTPIYNTAIPSYNIGALHIKSGNYIEAERHLVRGLDALQKLGMREEQMVALEYLAEVYEKTGRYALALAYQKKCMQLKDTLQRINNLNAINELDIKYRSTEKDKQLALQANRARIRNQWIIIGAGIIALLFVVLLVLLWHYRQRQKIYRQNEEISQLKAMMKGEEKERSRLSRDLHDGIDGMMAAISMGLSHLKDKIAAGKPYHYLESLVTETTHEIRRTAHNLTPSVLEREALQEALRQYCAGLSQKEGLAIEIFFNGPVATLEQASAILVYRMIQELLQNVVKHAEATLAEVQVSLQDETLNIIVEDNGKGFDQEKAHRGMGLSNMHYRVKALHGYLSIDSIKNKSTTVYIELQLEKLKLMS